MPCVSVWEGPRLAEVVEEEVGGVVIGEGIRWRVGAEGAVADAVAGDRAPPLLSGEDGGGEVGGGGGEREREDGCEPPHRPGHVHPCGNHVR